MIYPPNIEELLPAVVLNEGKISIPFSLNRAQGIGDVQDKVLYAKIKHIVSGIERVVQSTNINTDYSRAEFLWPNDASFPTGLFYKVQLGWSSEELNNLQPETYSSVGVFKLLNSAPNIQITIDADNIVVTYDDNNSQEKAYSGELDLYANSVLIFSTGLSVFLADAQETLFSIQYPIVSSEDNVELHCVFNGKTNNNFLLSASQNIQETTSITQQGLSISSNAEEGFVQVISYLDSNHTLYRNIIGTSLWWPITELKPGIPYNDFTIESEMPYRYAINANSGDEVSISNNSIFVPLNHILLRDTERQLKIQFNPKISNFKQTILEQKFDTIDGKYPIFMRNGATSYKEFGIGGIITQESDDQALFYDQLQQSNKNRDATPSSATEDYFYNAIFRNERIFREEVLRWLNNGGVKLFRSPAEGNILIRLTNISLTPLEQLGRRIYSFSATAYEIAPYSFTSLQDYNFFDSIDTKEIQAWTPDLSQEHNLVLSTIKEDVLYVDYGDNFTLPREDIV